MGLRGEPSLPVGQGLHGDGGVGHQLVPGIDVDEVGAGGVVAGQVSRSHPGAADVLALVPDQIILAAGAAPHGEADAAVAAVAL